MVRALCLCTTEDDLPTFCPAHNLSRDRSIIDFRSEWVLPLHLEIQRILNCHTVCHLALKNLLTFSFLGCFFFTLSGQLPISPMLTSLSLERLSIRVHLIILQPDLSNGFEKS